MVSLIADKNVEGQLGALLAVLEGEEWADLWARLSVGVQTFAALGLVPNAPDVDVWTKCQEGALILITANRSARGDDSLEAVIRLQNLPHHLPVITIGDPERLGNDRLYTEQAAVRLFEILLDLDNLRGTGRLYVP